MRRNWKGMKKWSNATARDEKIARKSAVRMKEWGGFGSLASSVCREGAFSRRKGGARRLSPTTPKMQPVAGRFFGKGAVGFVPRICDVQDRMASNAACENRMLTCVALGIVSYRLVELTDSVTSSLAISRIEAGSQEALSTSACAARTGGSGNKSSSGETPGAGCMGAGEIAITHATGRCAATRVAMAPPIE